MGDGQKGDLRLDFDRRVKVKFLGSKVTTDAGLLVYRELDEVLGLTEMAGDLLCDSRVGSNKQHRRVVAKVEWHCEELYPRVGFIVTNIWKAPERVVHFYNGRGTAEQWIKEGKNAVKWTNLSCRTFKDNQTRLQLFALAYNLANFLRRLALPASFRH